MSDLSRILIGAGLLLIGVGVIVHFLPKFPSIGRLPGDIFIKKDNFSFYFPFTTSIIFSLIVSFLLFLWNQKH